MESAPTQAELEAAHCWEPEDRVPGRPEMTELRRRLRLHQARWREAHGHPMGTQPFVARPGVAVRPVGSRLALDDARSTGASFVTGGALDAVRARMAVTEREQSIDHQRLWADLLSAQALAFNLFGDLAADVRRADRAVHGWWPDTPGAVEEVRFLHSPGRLDPQWLNSLRDFDAAFVLRLGDGTRGIVGLLVTYNDRLKPEVPKPQNAGRNREVAERSGLFAPSAIDRLLQRSDLWELFLEHLLLLSMLQHPSAEWTWGRYVVVHLQANTDIAGAVGRYRELLRDDATFTAITIESILASGALPKRAAASVRERYVPR